MSAQDELDKALEPLLARANQRASRIKQLLSQPQTEQTARAIASEKREIELIVNSAKAARQVVLKQEAGTLHYVSKAQAAIGRVVEVVEEATHFESLFHRTLDLFAQALPDPEPDEMPPLITSTRNVLARIRHMQASPTTYAATYPSRYPMPTHA